MKQAIFAATLLATCTTAQAATIDLSDNSFSSVTYETFVQGPIGPIIAFEETVDGVTFSFATSGQFRAVGTWGDGTTNNSSPWALQFGGASGNPGSFTLTVDADVQLNSYTGHGGPASLTTPIFDVTGTGVSSLGDTFSTQGFLGSTTPVVESFTAGTLNLVAGETYTFSATNASVVTTGYITSMDFTPTVVPVPAAMWLFASGLGALGYLGRRRQA